MVGVINSHILSHIFPLITKIVIILDSVLSGLLKRILHDKKALYIQNCQSSIFHLPQTQVGVSYMQGAEYLSSDLWHGYKNNTAFSHC